MTKEEAIEYVRNEDPEYLDPEDVQEAFLAVFGPDAGTPSTNEAWSRLCEAEKLEPIHCGCGAWSEHYCYGSGILGDMVEVEFMPQYHRSSHEAAGYHSIKCCGSAPANGAHRIMVTKECAQEMIENDPDWCQVVEK